MVDRQINRFA